MKVLLIPCAVVIAGSAMAQQPSVKVEQPRVDWTGSPGSAPDISVNILTVKETGCRYLVVGPRTPNNGAGFSVIPMLKQDGTPDCNSNK